MIQGVFTRIAVVVLIVGACSSATPSISTPPAADTPSSVAPAMNTPSLGSVCADAWATALGGRTNDEFVAYFTLIPVFQACTTVAEWTAEFDHYNGLPPSGLGYGTASAIEVLGEMCKFPEVADKPLCVAAR